MTDHPLTEEIMYELHRPHAGYSDPFGEDDMRAAADWQLKRDAEYFAEYLTRVFGVAPEVAEIRAKWFKEAMRPQEEDN